jgi:hypothetical protein
MLQSQRRCGSQPRKERAKRWKMQRHVKTASFSQPPENSKKDLCVCVHPNHPRLYVTKIKLNSNWQAAKMTLEAFMAVNWCRWWLWRHCTTPAHGSNHPFGSCYQ